MISKPKKTRFWLEDFKKKTKVFSDFLYMFFDFFCRQPLNSLAFHPVFAVLLHVFFVCSCSSFNLIFLTRNSQSHLRYHHVFPTPSSMDDTKVQKVARFPVASVVPNGWPISKQAWQILLCYPGGKLY